MESIAQIDVDYYQNGYDAGLQAIDILLNNKNPEYIPFQAPSKTYLEINPEKAKQHGIVFNDRILKSADLIFGQKEKFNPAVNIAMVHYVSSPDCDDVTKGILARLKEKGHALNDDFTFDEYNANADFGTLNTIVKVVAEKKYDLIFSTVLAATMALSSNIKDVPILFTVVADPVGNGLGVSYIEHQPNITGIDGLSYTDRGLELISTYLPDIKTVATLYCPGEMASLSGLKELEKSCKSKNINLISLPVNSVSEVVDATTLLCMKNIDAICQLPDNCTIPGFASMVKVTRTQKIPLFCFISSQVEMGAIAAVAGDYLQQGYEIADIGIEVINGKSTAEIPFSRIKFIRTVINPEAANAYGLETPKSMYESADQIIKK
jgi:putative ABC transport system substrate-binding protein